MRAMLSPEARIESRLRELECSGRNLVEIGKTLGVRVSHGPFSEALSGKGKSFDHETAEKLLDLLRQMSALQTDVGMVPVDWSRTNRVTVALTIRKVQLIAAELAGHSFDELAANATESVKQ